MPRKPKAKNTLSAGERVALFEAEQEQKKRAMTDDSASLNDKNEKTATTEPVLTQNEDKKPEKTRISKPKPQSATVRVDLSIPTGEIKPVHGMCNGPVSYGADISDAFREIGVPFVRFDGADTAAGGYAVDVSKIFRNPNADPTDPDNYSFELTDKYVESALLSGAKVIYRLGESRDLLGSVAERTYDNIDLLSRACVNIVRHYNDGWANGYHFDIQYFELWNGGDDIKGDIEIYGRLANAVKMYNESIKVGGMCYCDSSKSRELLRACKKHRYPVDFLTAESFAGNPADERGELESLAAFAKNQGFTEVEIILGRWMFVDNEIIGDRSLQKILRVNDHKSREIRRDLALSACSVKGAAYAAAMMLGLNDVDGVSTACFFDAQPVVSPFCSLVDRFGAAEKPFYAFRAYGELYKARNEVFCSVDRQNNYAHSGIYASAAMSDLGEGIILLASFGGCGVVDLRIDGITEDQYTADVYMLDGVKNMELADSLPLSGMKKRLVLNISEYGAVLIKLH